MEHLLSAWSKVAPAFSRANHIVLLSDYDGTLTPITERPEMAELGEQARAILGELARQRRYTVGIISGRGLSDLKARVGLKGVVYAGNHGLEIEGPAVAFVHPVAEELRSVLKVLYRVLCRGVSTIKGAMVEDKGLTLSVHYRLVEPTRKAEVTTAFEKAVRVARQVGYVKTTKGKRVYEVRPAVDWDKGKAISLILDAHKRAMPRIEPLVVYLGDDVTDEDGFRALKNVGGISISVGTEHLETSACYYLESPAETHELLSRLLDMERRRDQWTP